MKYQVQENCLTIYLPREVVQGLLHTLVPYKRVHK